MMTGYLILADGREIRLPTLSGWKVCHTSGQPCDCFELTCPVDSAFEQLLETVVRFRGEYDGKTVFYGVTDEMRFTYGRNGLVFFASGRGMAALLMDNQLGEAEYEAVSLAELCRIYADPFEVKYELGEYGNCTAGMTVTASASCWKVITDFTKNAMAMYPRFDREGVMVLGNRGGENRVIDDITEAILTLKRYGVISRLYINGAGCVYNQNALSRGIQCQKVITSSALAQYQIDQAEKGYFTLTVTLPEPFGAFPGDSVRLNGQVFGGTYLVDEAESAMDSGGSYCRLVLKKADG